MGIEKKASLVCVVVLALLFGIGLANRDHRSTTETAKAALGDELGAAAGAFILPGGKTPPKEPGPKDRDPVRPEIDHDPQPEFPGFREVKVRARDSFWKIAARELGDGSLHGLIAEANPGVNSKRLRVGQVLRIPTAVPAEPEPGETASQPGTGEYRIGKNETLSHIAAKVYGKSSRWKDIWAANKSVIPNPNRMPIGTVIVIP